MQAFGISQAPGPTGLGAFVILSSVSFQDSLPAWSSSVREVLSHWGIPGALVTILIALILGAIKLGPLTIVRGFWQCLAFVFDFARKRHARAAVEEQANAFFDRLSPELIGVSIPRVTINWVAENEDPRLLSDGRVIVRLRRERDQTRNVLAAMLYAVPLATFPHARPYLSKPLSEAIDLELLRKLAEQLGGQARAIMDAEILRPRTLADPSLRDLLPHMQALRNRGFFERVLLQELTYLSEELLSGPTSPGLSQEADMFIAWLSSVAAHRGPADQTNLLYVGNHFRVAFILTARAATATLGTLPYTRRLTRHLYAGARSIYLTGLTRAHTALCGAIDREFAKDRRIIRCRTQIVSVRRPTGSEPCFLGHYRRNDVVMSDLNWPDHVSTLGLKTGMAIRATVAALGATQADLRIDTLAAVLYASDAAWAFKGELTHRLQPGQRVTGVVLELDETQMTIRLGCKQLTRSPWEDNRIPLVGRRLWVQLEEVRAGGVVVRLLEAGDTRNESEGLASERGASHNVPVAIDLLPDVEDDGPIALPDVLPPAEAIYGLIPDHLWSVLSREAADFVPPEVGQYAEVEVARLDRAEDNILLSRVAVESAPWDQVRREYPDGTRVRARVLEVRDDGLLCEVAPGVLGRFDDVSVRMQGYELVDFKQTVKAGAEYEAVVIGHRPARRYLRLEFARPPAR